MFFFFFHWCQKKPRLMFWYLLWTGPLSVSLPALNHRWGRPGGLPKTEHHAHFHFLGILLLFKPRYKSNATIHTGRNSVLSKATL